MDKKHIQGSKDWLANRKKHIGASDAPIIMGVSPFSTPYKLWEDKLSISPPVKQNFAMERGNRLEPEARAAFEKEMDIEVFPQVIYHNEHKFMMASMDGLSLDGTVAVEIKCPGNEDHMLAMRGEIPPKYIPQLQHQLACSKLDMLWYYSFDGEKGISIAVQRDDDYIEEMIAKEAAFWELVQTFTPPPMTTKDYNKRECAVWAAYGNRLGEIDILMSGLKKEKELIKKELVADANGQSTKGGGIILTKSFPTGKVNYGIVPELIGVDLDQYRAAKKESWTLRVSKKRD